MGPHMPGLFEPAAERGETMTEPTPTAEQLKRLQNLIKTWRRIGELDLANALSGCISVIKRQEARIAELEIERDSLAVGKDEPVIDRQLRILNDQFEIWRTPKPAGAKKDQWLENRADARVTAIALLNAITNAKNLDDLAKENRRLWGILSKVIPNIQPSSIQVSVQGDRDSPENPLSDTEPDKDVDDQLRFRFQDRQGKEPSK